MSSMYRRQASCVTSWAGNPSSAKDFSPSPVRRQRRTPPAKGYGRRGVGDRLSSMPRALKVYRAHLGFFDTVVAAYSQKEALVAWGGGPGEFRQGFATVTNDERAVTAALANPGI